jgi:hypothetical protein
LLLGLEGYFVFIHFLLLLLRSFERLDFAACSKRQSKSLAERGSGGTPTFSTLSTHDDYWTGESDVFGVLQRSSEVAAKVDVAVFR